MAVSSVSFQSGNSARDAFSSSSDPLISLGGEQCQKITSLAFTSIRPDETLIGIASPKGAHTISHGCQSLGRPVVSPDENWLVFSSQDKGVTALFIKNLKDEERPIAKLTDGGAFEDAAVFSTDGKTIYFTTLQEGGLNICRAAFTPEDGIKMRNAELLTKGSNFNYSPAISPCGKFLAFCGETDRENSYQSASPSENYFASRIFMLELDNGGNPVPLTSGKDSKGMPVWEGCPAFSPDGSALFYYRQSDEDDNRRRNTAIYKMDLASKEHTRISPQSGDALYPRLSLKDRILFTYRTKDQGMWMTASTNFDGGDFRVETHDQNRNHWDASQSGDTRAYCVSKPTEDRPFPLETPSFFRVAMGQGAFLIQAFEKMLDDGHKLSVRVFRGYSPLVDIKMGKVFATQEFGAIISSDLEGREIKKLYSQTPVFGLAKGRNSPWLFSSAGAPFNEGVPCDIVKVHAETGEARNVTRNGADGRSVWPSVTEDGNTLVFQNRTDRGPRIMIADGEGSSLKPLLTSEKAQMMPAISTSGKMVSFTQLKRTKDSMKAKLKLVTIDPISKTVIKVETLLKDSYVYFHSTFSPDEEWIAVSSNRGGLLDEKPHATHFFNPQPYGEIFMIRMRDKKVVRITQDIHENSLPSLS